MAFGSGEKDLDANVLEVFSSTMDEENEGASGRVVPDGGGEVPEPVERDEDQQDADDNETDEMEVDLVTGRKKRKKTSWVWNELKEIVDKEGNPAV